jgi:hypothetical protein
MKNETGTTSLLDCRSQSLPYSKVVGDALHSSPAPALQPKEIGNGVLLKFCDRVFFPLMAGSLAAAEPAEKPYYSHGFGDMGDDHLGAYLAQMQAAPDTFLTAYRQSPDLCKGGVDMSARGLGPSVYIGFDAEWEFERRGRNRVLSVQFFLIGSSGLTHTQVLHLGGKGAVTERPSLAQALNDLLEEAMDFGVITEWPGEVVLVGFFTRADITVFSDFKKLRPQLDGVGGTLVTVKEAAQVELPLSPKREAQLKSQYQFVVGDPFDASRLAPPGQSLARLGQWLGLEKLELPLGFSKDKMSEFQTQNKAAFEAYGLRDAEIAVTYLLWVFWFANRYLGLQGLSATASSLSVRLAEQCIRKDGVAPDVALNYDVVERKRWNPKTDRAVTVKNRTPKRIRSWPMPTSVVGMSASFLARPMSSVSLIPTWLAPT